jgi:hypothetical protein
MAVDAASVTLRHIRVDQNGRLSEFINSDLNECLSLSANLDQTAKALIQDVVLTMFDEGTVAIVATDTTGDPVVSQNFDVQSLRVGVIMEWKPSKVRVKLYDESTGTVKEIYLDKREVVIVENPLYNVMNEPNGTLKRLVGKLNQLDADDQRKGTGKLDVIIQLPYTIKTETKRKQAEQRRSDLEDQLTGAQYGVGYIDATEHIVQLNRPVENQLLAEITELKIELYSQLGITPAVFNGTANEQEMQNYYNRTLVPILLAIVDGMRRRFLSKTARTQGQTIGLFRDPLSSVPFSVLTTLLDTLLRNKVITSNDVRSVMGYLPSKEGAADKLNPAPVVKPAGTPPKVENPVPANNLLKGDTKNDPPSQANRL